MFFDHSFWVLTLALAFEYTWGDPRSNWHPVATFGGFAKQLEKLLWKDSKFAGAFAWFLVCFSSISIMITIWYHFGYGNDWLSITLQALLLWVSLGWKSLIQHVQAIGQATDIEQAKEKVGFIVGRNTDNMSEQDIHRAGIESLAENTSDSIIAPLFWFILFGALGAWVYRMINTLDAMWGYKNERYQRFGWFAAKIDDMANLIPARLTALLMLIQQPQHFAKPIYTQAKQHLSPNAGFPETAMAFLLGIRLGGPVQREHTTEQRAWMGEQDTDITQHHIKRAIRISNTSVITLLGAMYLTAIYLGFLS